MDIALNSFSTPHRHITILDAPGHKDFIPNMISGASQADCALLVVDASTGEFEAGFDRGGQTREHLVLVRSLGVSQVVVAVNKLDVVGWDQSRYTEIVDTLKPFLLQTGFQTSKTKFAPVAAMSGVNLVNRDGVDGAQLRKWYKGPTLVDLLGKDQASCEILQGLDPPYLIDKLEPPARDITSPFRFPISNVFKGSGSTTGVTGRVCTGAVQTGEKLRIVPGDESGIVKSEGRCSFR
jgi:elongation factor 1 alpha-like protein